MDANKLFERAMQASERGNHDYAIELFQQLLVVQPEHLKARKELRNVERRKIQETGGRTAFVQVAAGIKGMPNLVKIGIFKLLSKHEQRMIECEKYLKNDPHSRVLLAALARSAEDVGYTKPAIQVYEDIKDLYPNDLGSLRRLARLYVDNNNIDSVSECFQRILAEKPQDEEAGKAVKDLAALKTMKDGKWEQAGQEGGYRQMLKDEAKATDMEKEQHVMRSQDDFAARIERVKSDVEKDPRNTKILLQLADLYTRAANNQQARSVYKQVKEIDPRNLVVDRKVSELDVADKQSIIAKLEAKLKSNPDDNKTKTQLGHEKKALAEFQIKRLEALVAASPTDMSLRSELGRAHWENKDIEKAIPQFQQASNDPKLRRQSNKMLGHCFQYKKRFEMATAFFEKALEEASGTSSEGKEIIYNLGVCYEEQGDTPKALDAYNRILMVDYGYRDVSDRLDKIQEGASS